MTDPRRYRIVINGKSAGDPALREAVGAMRDAGHEMSVRVTWEQGDAERFTAEAVADGTAVVIAGGGDGTVNAVANGLLESGAADTAMAVLPYGTANDFASSIGMPAGDPHRSLALITRSPAVPIDAGVVNGRCFVNVASGGFGAEVTATTPRELKRVLGGVAYSIMGLLSALKMSPYHGRVTADGLEDEGTFILFAVGNGVQAGGGHVVTPDAMLDDGMLDVMVIHDFDMQDVGAMFAELTNLSVNNEGCVRYHRLKSFELETDKPLALNLDGEPIRDTRFSFDTLHRRLRLVMPPQGAEEMLVG